MSIRIILGNDLDRIERQIRALEYIIPKDNEKDRDIHLSALKILKEKRKLLVSNGGIS